MTSTTAATLSAPRAQTAAGSRTGWLWFVAIGALFVAWHGTYILRMIYTATNATPGKSFLKTLGQIIEKPWNPDWSHVLVIPFISFYFVMRDRPQLAVTPRRVYLPGLAILILGMLSFLWWIHPGRNDMFQGISMVVALFGLVLFLLGPGMMRYLWLPVVYMLLFVKVSNRIWEVIANRLQDIAAVCSTFVLQVLGLVSNFSASRTGNHITLEFTRDGVFTTHPLAIAEACSGLRMMMAFIALGVAMAFIGKRTWWQRGLMLALTLPIAIAVNVGRVVALGIVMMYNEEMAKGDFHTFIGMLMLIPAAMLFMGVGWVLDRLVIHEEQPRTATRSTPGPSADGLRLAPSPLHSALGVIIGAVLAALVGLNYFLLFVAMRPAGMLNIDLGQSMRWLLLAGGVLLLVLAGAGLWRILRGASLRAGNIALGVAVGVLLTGLLGFNAIASVNEVVLIKDPVPLRQKLYNLHGEFGPWRMIHEDPPLTAEEMQYLKTDDYVSYHYQDIAWPQETPGQLVRLHIAYYTGTVDTVPHVPDRCMTAGGAKLVSLAPVTLELDPALFQRRADGSYTTASRLAGPVALPALTIKATLFRYRIPQVDDRVRSAIYFFIANDQYFATPEGVRVSGFDPTDRYSYYCKVEMNLDAIGGEQKAAQRAGEFLNTLLPEIMACLPDWDEVTAKPQAESPASGAR